MMKLLLWGLLIYFLYNLIFRFVVPVSKATSQMKDQVRKMQEQQAAALREFEKKQADQKQREFEREQAVKTTGEKKNEDYIDFEEVK